MPVRPRLIASVAAPTFAVALAACQTVPQETSACTPNQACTQEGELLIQNSAGSQFSAALLRDGRPCMPLLLSDAMVASTGRLNGQRVRVSGDALARAPEAPDVIQLQYRDRWLQTGFCGDSPVILYVATLS